MPHDNLNVSANNAEALDFASATADIREMLFQRFPGASIFLAVQQFGEPALSTFVLAPGHDLNAVSNTLHQNLHESAMVIADGMRRVSEAEGEEDASTARKH